MSLAEKYLEIIQALSLSTEKPYEHWGPIFWKEIFKISPNEVVLASWYQQVRFFYPRHAADQLLSVRNDLQSVWLLQHAYRFFIFPDNSSVKIGADWFFHDGVEIDRDECNEFRVGSLTAEECAQMPAHCIFKRFTEPGASTQ